MNSQSPRPIEHFKIKTILGLKCVKHRRDYCKANAIGKSCVFITIIYELRKMNFSSQETRKFNNKWVEGKGIKNKLPF